VPTVTLDRHKLIQILANLLTNAHQALKERTEGPRVLTLRIHARAPGWFVIEIQDTGIGIPPDALGRLFEFGFTTKKEGHGFGLHSSALLAQDLGGHLAGHSDGAGCGAQFALRLPLTAVCEMPARKLA
jgi:signal transduction histidine kinase